MRNLSTTRQTWFDTSTLILVNTTQSIQPRKQTQPVYSRWHKERPLTLFWPTYAFSSLAIVCYGINDYSSATVTGQSMLKSADVMIAQIQRLIQSGLHQVLVLCKDSRRLPMSRDIYLFKGCDFDIWRTSHINSPAHRQAHRSSIQQQSLERPEDLTSSELRLRGDVFTLGCHHSESSVVRVRFIVRLKAKRRAKT